MGKRFLSMASVMLLMGVVLAACGSGGSDEADPTVTRIPNPPNAPVLSPTPGAEGEGTPAAGSPVAVDGSPVSGSPVAGSPSAEEPAATDAGTGEAIVIASHDIFFEPKEFTIPAGTKVVVSLPNEGAAPHNFTIEELDISVDQAPGETHEITIEAPAGVYEYYCDVPGHRESGMTGTLTVE